jgi:hypothetical protein
VLGRNAANLRLRIPRRGAFAVFASILIGASFPILSSPAGMAANTSSVVASNISIFAGTGTPTPGVNGGNGGPATQATFDAPFGVAADSSGTVFISDSENAVIRRVDMTGIVNAFAGTGVRGYLGDGGPAVNAELGSGVYGLAADAKGDVFVADTYYIRKIDPNGIITTIGGNGSLPTSGAPVPADGTPALSVPMSPYALTADAAGDVFFSDSYVDYVREITTVGLIKAVAGNGVYGNSGDGGSALNAEISYPGGLLADNSGNLYLSSGAEVRVVKAAGIISTVAGNGTLGDNGDGGLATNAELSAPYGLAKDSSGNLFISDFSARKIREVSADGIVTTLAAYGTGDGSDPLQGLDSSPINLTLSPDQATLYVTMTGEVQAIHLAPAAGGGGGGSTLPNIDAGTFIKILYSTPGGNQLCTTGFGIQEAGVKYETGAKHCIDNEASTQVDNNAIAAQQPMNISTLDEAVDLKPGKYVFASSINCSPPSPSACLLPSVVGGTTGDMFAWKPDISIPSGQVQTPGKLLPVLGVKNWQDVAGQKICHYGWGSSTKGNAERCGVAFSSAAAAIYCGIGTVVCDKGTVLEPMSGSGGDSGGPVYVYNPSKTGVYAIGITVLAAGQDCLQAFGKKYACLDMTEIIPIKTVLSRLGGATLITG